MKVDMMKRLGFFILFLWLVGLVILLACAPKETSIQQAEEKSQAIIKEGRILQKVSREGWEEKWQSTLNAAQKEGRVVVYGSSQADSLKKALPTFEKKFGFTIEVVSGRGAEVRAKLLQERANGLFIPDAFISGLETIYGSVKPSGATEPFETELMLPEVLDQKAWFGGKLPWGDEQRHVFTFIFYSEADLYFNTNLVKPGEIKSYYDLLDPRWKGKIIMNDPTTTGTAFGSFSSLLHYKLLDMDFFRQLVRQQPVMNREERLQVDWLARGKYHVALWSRRAHVVQYREAGAPIAWGELKEATFMSVGGGAVTLIKNRPHPNASRIFINWLLSKEGQILQQKAVQRQSARVDIPTEGLDHLSIRNPGQNYFRSVSGLEEWVLKEQGRYLKLAEEAFGPLLGK